MSQSTVLEVDADGVVDTITASWRKTVTTVLETARLLVEHSTRSDWDYIKKELETRGVMKAQVLSMMMGIGQNQLLNDRNYIDQLPSGYNTLYHLSLLDDLQARLKSREISPDIRLKDVRSWRKAGTSKIKAAPITKLIISMLTEDFNKHKNEIYGNLKEFTSACPYIEVTLKK